MALLVAGCSGNQSALAPAGTGAASVARLFWVMVAGATLVWIAVVAIALWSGARRRQAPAAATSRRTARWLVIGGGMVAPTLLLGALLTYGLALMPRLRAPPAEGAQHDGLRIAVTGEQWWWRVKYLRPGHPPVELANEVWLPAGERTRLLLDSPDVIHAFWVPALAGKVDMIPGRTTTLVLEPTKAGVFSGACAEFCGTSHAFMRFDAVVAGRAAFDAWLEHQASPAAPPATPSAHAGQAAFLRNGCSACHAIRGTPATGRLGPDLTHVGGRRLLAAGVLPNDVAGFRRWITDTHAVKPDAVMPEFGMLPDADVQAIAAYLDGLQ
ncbi:MAG TPA: cytochrome c oxidase subunit II [Xanthomonadaceae bacterium]|nr:cytochrome c oxidase subunit II [Xanthomonadaceae bacterium]